MIRHNLGGPLGNLDLPRHQLISLACVPNNTFHLWLTTTFNGSMIIPDKALQHLPPGMRDILHLIKQNAAAIYVRELLHLRQDQINILQNNPRQHQLTPLSSNFEDVIVSWYRDSSQWRSFNRQHRDRHSPLHGLRPLPILYRTHINIHISLYHPLFFLLLNGYLSRWLCTAGHPYRTQHTRDNMRVMQAQ